MRILKSLFVLGAGAAMTSGCVAVGAVAAASVGMAGAQDRTYGEALDDAMASNTVKARLMAVDNVGYAHVDVEVAAGRLLLSGFAPSEQHRATAELIARNVGGVREIFNEIVVGENQGMARSARDELITAQVRTRLVASRAVRGLNANIETHNGTVYLMGVMRSQEELERAAQIASQVSGVTRVVSLMTTRSPAATVVALDAPTPAATSPSPAAPQDGGGAPLGEAQTAQSAF